MSFNPNTPLDPGQVTDVRGSRFGGRGLLLGGGGGVGIILVIIYLVLGGNPAGLGTAVDPGAGPQSGASTLQQQCSTGADANQREDCRIVGYVNSVQKFWTEQFNQSGQHYQPAKTVLFTGQVSTGCGDATTAFDPFYCPQDKQGYLDPGFFNDLHTKFGEQCGSLAAGDVEPLA